ncbi:MAG: hypothetical protein ABI277_01710 [Burkholderiaceae bacterium]
MRASITTLLLLACLTMLGGCATIGAQPSPTRDGKCHTDFNSPDCVYLF